MEETVLELIAAKAVAVLLTVWHRLISPPIMRLVGPLVGAGVCAAGWWLWQRAGGSALGRAARWWCVAVAAALGIGALAYFGAVLPDDPAAAAAAQVTAAERPGRTLLPAPLAALGAASCALAFLAAAWQWRRARLAPAETAALSAATLTLWRRWRRTVLLAVVGVPAAAATACTAAVVGATVGQPQVPLLTVPGATVPGATAPGGSTTSVTSVASARGVLWVGTSSGVDRLMPGEPGQGNGAWRTYRAPRAPLPSNHVTALAAGPDGTVWIGTTAGLARVEGPPGSEAWETYDTSSSALPNARVLGLAVDRRGSAWVATAAGGAALHADGHDRGFSALNAPLNHLVLDAVLPDREGRVWFAGAGGVNVYVPAPGGGGEGEWPVGFGEYVTGSALPDDLVFAVFGDSRGRIWFGTLRGAAVFTPAPDSYALGVFGKARWQTFTGPAAPFINKQLAKVHVVAEDRRGRIWMGTEEGVLVLDESAPPESSARWTVLGVGRRGERTLPHPWVQALALGPDGRMWAGTKGGLSVIDPERLDAGWETYRAHPLRRWTGHLWPDHWAQNLIANDVTALAFAP